MGRQNHNRSAGPGIFVLDCESGVDDFDVLKTDRIREYSEVLQAIEFAAREGAPNHGVKWIAIDTIDWVERMIQEKVAKDNGQESFGAEAFSYGKGRKLCLPYWQEIMSYLDRLSELCGVGVILLSHTKKVKITKPDAPEYQMNVPSLDDEARQIFVIGVMKSSSWISEPH